MKIIITENKIDRVKGLIEKQGVKSAIQLMGGLDNLAKVLGYNSIPEYIFQYLSENAYPDYGWESPDYYREQVDRFGSIQFNVNDRVTFDYTEFGNGNKKLEIYPWLYNEMEEFFSINDDDIEWVKIIVNWFENKTGLKVDFVE